MKFLQSLGIKNINSGCSTGIKWFEQDGNETIESISPINDQVIGSITCTNSKQYDEIVEMSNKSFFDWRTMPAPKRGDIVRQLGNTFRDYKKDLAHLISYEMGKTLQEGLGEVQEVVDICDFAVGLSRQLYGLTMTSEREQHRLYEQYHPYGPTGVITAFNFPAAVWAWNATLAAVCGNTIIWKPSSKTPLTAVAIQYIVAKVLKANALPEGIFSLVIGKGKDIGNAMIKDSRIPLISFTGSCQVGRHVSSTVASRFGRSILELGGNNAIIITPSANLDLAIPATLFSAIGTAGQRCTTLRRLIIHDKIYDQVKNSLLAAYRDIKTGNPLDEDNHMGPLIDKEAVTLFKTSVNDVASQHGRILYGGKVLEGEGFSSGCYVEPTLAEVGYDQNIVQDERFVPILYLIKYSGQLETAIKIQNSVKQGLSSAIFTNSLQEAEMFLSVNGSDCGIANVNIGTSGAEIGGAFGGEKETGGGRESGSDAWKNYMRRQTNTINYGSTMPLAQGIKFKV